MDRRRRIESLVAVLGLVLLLVLHLDFWRPQVVRLHFGWLPEELLYRLVWMLFAWGYLLFFCARIWPDDGAGE